MYFLRRQLFHRLKTEANSPRYNTNILSKLFPFNFSIFYYSKITIKVVEYTETFVCVS